jgi:hypothetical protein
MTTYLTDPDAPMERLLACRDAFGCGWAEIVKADAGREHDRCPLCGGRMIVGKPRRGLYATVGDESWEGER